MRGIRKKYKPWVNIWHMPWGVALWTIWIKRNAQLFNQEQWHELKMDNVVWEECIIYGKMVWKNTLKEMERCPLPKATITIEKFDILWGAWGMLCCNKSLTVSWNWRVFSYGVAWGGS